VHQASPVHPSTPTGPCTGPPTRTAGGSARQQRRGWPLGPRPIHRLPGPGQRRHPDGGGDGSVGKARCRSGPTPPRRVQRPPLG
jgi:hypothetical protein